MNCIHLRNRQIHTTIRKNCSFWCFWFGAINCLTIRWNIIDQGRNWSKCQRKLNNYSAINSDEDMRLIRFIDCRRRKFCLHLIFQTRDDSMINIWSDYLINKELEHFKLLSLSNIWFSLVLQFIKTNNWIIEKNYSFADCLSKVFINLIIKSNTNTVERWRCSYVSMFLSRRIVKNSQKWHSFHIKLFVFSFTWKEKEK